MKKTLKAYTYSLMFILFSTFIFSLILTVLKQKNIISLTSSNITSAILSLLLFFIGSLILGLKIKKKGLFNGMILSIIYVSINLIIGFDLTNIASIIKFVSKIILIIMGSILGVNLSK